MSAWRHAVRAMYALGGARTTAEIADRTIDDPRSGLFQALKLGLVEHPKARPGAAVKWKLTQRGIDWCENRVTHTWDRPGGRRWVATWLSSLPRGISLPRSQA